MQKTIVVSAVNLRKGGTLTILRQCLNYLSELAKGGEYRVVALVHKRELCDYEGVEYIEMPNIIKGWGKRLWCEYVTMNKISKQLFPVYLWLSLHDTSPRVQAERQAVYCQTSFPFYKWSWRDFYFDVKIPLFANFTRFAYRINVHSNRYLVVQQEWLRDGFSKMLGVDKQRFIVAPPQRNLVEVQAEYMEKKGYTFFFPASPDCHKNFETLCEATRLLEMELGKNVFKVWITINGSENRYARWLHQKWGNVDSISFKGYLTQAQMKGAYESVDCLVFPSKVETWGLPISEFLPTQKPMLLADLPYAHESASGSVHTSFFSVTEANRLKDLMKTMILKDMDVTSSVEKKKIGKPCADSWKDLFELLLEK